MNTSINIIIADDHQLFIDGIKSILENEINISIIGEALNGVELIQQIKQNPSVNFVITDIRMPVLDGLKATEIIHKDFSNINVLALSMFDQEEDIIEMLNAGAKGYVSKNVSKSELVKAIHTVSQGNYFFGKTLNFSFCNWKSKSKPKKSKLTKREKQIVSLIGKGRTSIQIAEELSLSKLTIDTHRKHIHQKLNIKSNTALICYALKNKDLLL